MRFKSFEIKNFKGIEHTKIDLAPAGGNIFTLVGLNESGKTTLLEAINAFSILKVDTESLYTSNNIKTDPVSYVPKHLKANFTGDVTITAILQFEGNEKEEIITQVENGLSCKINRSCIPNEISIVRGFHFENSDFKKPIYTVGFTPKAIPKGGRVEKVQNFFTPIGKAILDSIVERAPKIIYFSTFLFSQPDKIILNPDGHETPINKHYREIIDSVAASLKRPLDVQTHIVDRIVNEETVVEKVVSFWGLAPDKQEQINASLNQLSSHLTETVFQYWHKIFGGDFKNREIVLKLGIDPRGDEQDVYLQFSLRDGTTHYNISERSLGFRWFFSFLLFTLYKVKSSESSPILFLLDEPASNLHAKAQTLLLESLPKIAIGSNQIIYSTHSHYLINPEWLDQAFIVSNSAINYELLDDSDKFANDTPSNIHVDKYRSFVGKNPDRFTYFQPVLDKLDIIPSRLDIMRSSILVEGKGDYLILEYARKVLLKDNSEVAIVPTRGAKGMNELIGLFLGWGVKFSICLDDDKEGISAKKTYLNEWGLSEDLVVTLSDLDSSLKGKTIEGFLEDSDKKIISEHFGIFKQPDKNQIQLFFSEKLSKEEHIKLSEKFLERIKTFNNFANKLNEIKDEKVAA